MQNKNNFTNAFTSALNRPKIVEPQTFEHLNVQTSERPNIQTSKRLEIEVENKTMKKKSLKDLGWVPTTIYLPKKLKEKLKLKSIKEKIDMSEIIVNNIENNL